MAPNGLNYFCVLQQQNLTAAQRGRVEKYLFRSHDIRSCSHDINIFPHDERSFSHAIIISFSRHMSSKIVSMIRKYHNHKPQTNPWHREEESHNHHETLGRQTKQSSQLSLPHQDNCKTRMYIK